MKLESLPKINQQQSKRLGRGPGSGKGKTAGRGTKGQNARKGLPITHSHYEGGQRPLFKRLPLKRGKGNWRNTKKPVIVNLKILSILPASVTMIDLPTLIKHGIVKEDEAKTYGVKILGEGEIKRPLTFKIKTSQNAAQKIRQAGGKTL